MDKSIREQLKQALLDYEEAESARLAEEWIAQGGNPTEAMAVLTEAIQIVGDGFGSGELFLPDLVGAATAMEAAVKPLQEAVRASGLKREALGVVVLGTVAGDIHTIGKSMVAALLSAAGFEVHDIGIDVSTESFIQSVTENKADILAMSALLTSTAREMQTVIEALGKAGLRDEVRVMVGGGALTADYAQSIGADGYSPSATGAVDVARELTAENT